MSAIPPIGAGIPAAGQGPGAVPPPRGQAAAAAPAPPLWHVLTDEERAYFQSMAALGPVSYGPGGGNASAPASPVGQRVDVTG